MPGQSPELHNRLHALRTEAGLTQAQLAEMVGVSRKSVNKVENGIFIPSSVLALKLARALRCPMDQLFWLPAAAGADADTDDT
ncbi:helix-turn-helix transcriptional regulator [Altererythrobacter sp. ZODW24]|uniref:helix-turn-helix transcriptional regulator n=1 Tax=Altererythrobacter sp. ZODW24 TaxID=2185142 RepID=UPI000DF7639D|nr:helix-turn-helix transcriptional regulator [Altererythrobacter sp. ZODW24]